MNSPEVKKFIRENSGLFWSARKEVLDEISNEALVETILNFGTEKSVKKLFDLLGIKKVAKIFYASTINRKRVNYFPRTVHYFNLYFNKYAH